MNPRTWTAALLAAAMLLAVAVRLRSWPEVFAGGEVLLLADTDPHYHVLRAQRMAAGEPGAPWFDPRLDWPNGARIPWPPLFDAMLAAAARVSSPEPAIADVARVGVFLPPAIGALAVLVAGLLGMALAGRAAGVIAAFGVALLPAHSDTSSLGRIDQHAMEVLLSLLTWWLFVAAWSDGLRRRVAAACGVVLALAFWNWMGSALIVCFLAAAVGALWVLGLARARAAAEALAISTGVGAALLAVSVAALAPPGALSGASLLGVGGLHVGVLAGCSGFGAVLAAAARARRIEAPGAWRRGAEIAVALAVPAVVLLGAFPDVRAGVLHGLRVLGASGAWYGNIAEFQPLLGLGAVPLVAELRRAAAYYGLFPVGFLLGIPLLVLRWREEPSARPELAVLALWAALAAALGLARIRFGPYAAALLVVAFGAELAWLAGRIGRRRGVALRVATLAAGFVIAALPAGGQAQAAIGGPVVDALRWLREQPPATRGAVGVAGDWDLGHVVQFYANRPVLVSPFGTEAGEHAMEDWAALVFAAEEEAAEDLLARRRIGWIVLHDSVGSLATLHAFAPPGTPAAVEVVRDWRQGERVRMLPGLSRTLYFRLFVRDGLSHDGSPLRSVRLVHEAGTGFGAWQYVKIFGVVPGARIEVRGARPGGTIRAEQPLRTAVGRSLAFVLSAPVGPDGSAVLRVPYATGPNGTTLAGPVRIADGANEATIAVPEEAVVGGRSLEARLGGKT